MSPQKDAASPREKNRRAGQSSKQKELTHADVVAGNDQRREQIKRLDQTGERHPDQQGDTANIRQNTSNVNRKHMR